MSTNVQINIKIQMRHQQQNQTPMLAVNIKIFRFRFFFWKLVMFISQNRWTKRLFPSARHPSSTFNITIDLAAFPGPVLGPERSPPGSEACATDLLVGMGGRSPSCPSSRRLCPLHRMAESRAELPQADMGSCRIDHRLPAPLCPRNAGGSLPCRILLSGFTT